MQRIENTICTLTVTIANPVEFAISGIDAFASLVPEWRGNVVDNTLESPTCNMEKRKKKND